MSKLEKLKSRLLSEPTDFTFNELGTLLKSLGYILNNAGNTSGSSVKFINPTTNHNINFHRPHPSPILKSYVIKRIISELKKEGYFDGK